MTTTIDGPLEQPVQGALHGPLLAAFEEFGAETERLQASTRNLLLGPLEPDDDALTESAASGLGTRRHVLARLARQAERRTAALAGDPEPIADDRLLRLGHGDLVDALSAALGAVTGELAASASRGDVRAALAEARDQLAWVELTRVDLGIGHAISSIPDAALDAVAAHFRARTDSPFAALVAA